MSHPEISVVLPCFDEVENIPELRRRLVAVLEATVAHGPIPLPDGGPRGLGASRRSTD